jgi:hypothetical protein
MKTRHLVMAAGLLVATWLAFFADNSPTSNISEPVTRETAARKTAPVNERATQSNTVSSAKLKGTPGILVLQDRAILIGGSHKSSGKNLFGSKSWMPPPPPPPKPAPPPPPMAPPLPFTYIGKKFDGANWEVYLMRGDQTFIVRVDVVLENTYHIDSIKPPLMTLTYLPLQQVQTLTIGGTD